MCKGHAIDTRVQHGAACSSHYGPPGVRPRGAACSGEVPPVTGHAPVPLEPTPAFREAALVGGARWVHDGCAMVQHERSRVLAYGEAHRLEALTGESPSCGLLACRARSALELLRASSAPRPTSAAGSVHNGRFLNCG